MSFHVGQKVVCINDTFEKAWRRSAIIPHLPVRLETYTVRKVGLFHFNGGEEPAVWLREISNPIVNWSSAGRGEIGFWAARFRPLVERKTDISFAHEILRKASRKQGASA